MKTCLLWKLSPSQFNALPHDDQLYMLMWARYQDKRLDTLDDMLAQRELLTPEAATALTIAKARSG